jgi:mannose-6-phosphate isomerase-like protein (cupin superfamily)
VSGGSAGEESGADVVRGEGYAVAPSADALGEGYGFRKVRKQLDVTAFGVNLITIPPGYETGRHLHERQEELYFVHRGAIEMEFGDGSAHRIEAGGAARVDPSTVRKVRNASDSEDAMYLVAGGEGGYVGRDGLLPEGEESRFGAGGQPR